MSRARLASLIAALVALVALVAALPASADSLSISSAGSARFPDRSFVITLPPGSQVSPSQVHVTENGRGVDGPSFVSASSTGSNRFGVVLVIDSSTSMSGAPLQAAVAAAREFAVRRNPQQRVGVVLFNRSTKTVLAPTTDAAAIRNALSHTPPVAGGTRMYDATNAGIEALKQARISAGSVIVLSDGADNGSTATVADVATQARDAGARVYAVGLHDAHYDSSSLTQLAAAGRGQYAEASSPAQLKGIYDRLAVHIASQYLLSYQSLQGPGVGVKVNVAVEGYGATSIGYKTPALPKAPEHQAHSAWTSGIVLVGVVFGAALLISLALISMIVLLGRRRKLENRMAAFVGSVAGPTAEFAPQGGGHRIGAGIFDSAERAAERLQWWPKFKEEVDLARIEVPPIKIAIWVAFASFSLLVLCSFAGNFLIGLVLALAIPAGTWAFVHFKASRQRKQFAEQLADNLQVIASAMRAGNSFVGALSVAARDAAEPARTELQRAVTDERLGVPFEDALRSVAKRMDNQDLNQVILVAALQRETGGNTAEILDRVAETIRERMALRRFVNTLTAQGRMTRWIVTALPILLAIAIETMSPNYLHPLFHTTGGVVMVGFAIVLLITGSIAISRIVNIEI